MLDSMDGLCGYIYFTSTSSFLYFCALCESCFESSKEFQNHSLKEHHLKSANEINFKAIEVSRFDTENGLSTDFPQKSDDSHIYGKLTDENQQFKKESYMEIEKANISDQDNDMHENYTEEILDLASSNSNVDFDTEYEQEDETNIEINIENLTDKSESNFSFTENNLHNQNLQCKYCEKQFSKLDTLIQHTNNHINYVLTCRICGKHSKRRSHALRHERIHSKIQCDVCNCNFSSENDLDIHVKGHSTLKCTFCAESFKKINDIQNHLEIEHIQEKPYKCDDCPATFVLKNNLKAHVAVKHTKKRNLKEKQYQCTLCKKKFQNDTTLRQHNSKIHPGINGVALFCSLCSRHFDELNEFTTHMNIHSEKPFQNNDESIVEDRFSDKVDVIGQETINSDFNLKNIIFEDSTVKLEREFHIKIEEIYSSTKENDIKEELMNKTDAVLNYTSNIKEENDQSDTNIENASTFLPFGLDDIDEINFQCKYCKKQFSARVNLIHHTKDHLDYTLTCKICGKHSSRKSHARIHEKTHIRLKCDLCDATFSNEKALDKHKTRHEKLKCKFCSKIFKKCDAIQNHLRTHTGEKPYKCDVCSSAFAIKKNLQTHIITQHTGDIKNFSCKFCDRRFKTKQLRDWHTKRVHLKEKPNQCEFCGLNFANMSGLRRHKLKRHTEYNQRPHPCKLCDKKFVELKNLTEHMNTHTGEKPFQCNICVKSFGQQSSLREHKKLHTGKKTHICRICGKAFAQHSGCSNHMKQHRMAN